MNGARVADDRSGAGLELDHLAALEEERDFLLRSLDDLDREHAAGELDDDEYVRLHDDYTARAAAVIRSLRAGGTERAGPAHASTTRRLLTVLLVVVVVSAAAILLGRSLGERTRGRTITGNDQSSETVTTLAMEEQRAEWARQRAEYESRVAAAPDGPEPHRELARFLLAPSPDGTFAPDDLFAAFQEYARVVELEPTDVEARAYGGWALTLYATAAQLPEGSDRTTVLETALASIDSAIELDPGYPDAQVFRGLTMVQGYGDVEGARPYLERYLELVPDGEYADMVRQFLDTPSDD